MILNKEQLDIRRKSVSYGWDDFIETIDDLQRQLADHPSPTIYPHMDRDLCRLSIISTWPTKDGLICQQYPDRIIDSIMKIVDAYVQQRVDEELTPPKEMLSHYDEAVDKAYSVGALKMLKNAEAEIGRWLIHKLAVARSRVQGKPVTPKVDG